MGCILKSPVEDGSESKDCSESVDWSEICETSLFPCGDSPSKSVKVVCRGTDDSFCIINCPILVGKHVGS